MERMQPVIPARPDRAHRFRLVSDYITDPAREPGNDEETLPAFERVAVELETRIRFLIDAITTTRQEVTERA